MVLSSASPFPNRLPSNPPSAAGPPTARVRDPGELVAAVPVVLGFHPRESLVLVGTSGASGRRLGLTLRVDLPPPDDVEDLCRAAARSLRSGGPAGAAVIVVAGTGGDPPRPEVAAAARAAAAEQGIEVHTVVWAEHTGAGARWACYDPCGCSGLVPDPRATPVAAAAVAAGHVVYADRAELERLVAPADQERLRRRDSLLTRAVDHELAGPDLAAPGDLAPYVAVVDAAIEDAAAGHLDLDDGRVLALAGALVLPAVRDAALARCAGPSATAAEQLWAALVRETPDPEAAEPAALLAVSALLRGDGALANVALDRAERAWPGHRLTGILRSAADVGLRPEQMRECLRLGLGAGGLDGAGLDGAGLPPVLGRRPREATRISRVARRGRRR